MIVPARFADGVVQAQGEVGREWIRRLPEVLAELAKHWELEIKPPFEDLTNNYVAPAIDHSGREWVLKLVVGGAEGDREAVALVAYNGRGAVRLERHDLERRAMLLERISPGRDLRETPDPEAAGIAADVLARLWLSVPVLGLKELREWTSSLERFAVDSGPLPRRLVERAAVLRDELLASSAERVVVHGDLHHTNVLWSKDRGWLAIDPKGLVGERTFDIASFLLNPGPVPLETTRRRIDAFVDRLGLERRRVIDWAFVQAVLSACWTLEDNGTWWDGAIRFAMEIKGLK